MIPATAHFIWFGNRFPWANVLAIRSAARFGGFERVILHCDHDLSTTPYWEPLTTLPGFEARALDPAAIFNAAPGGDALMTIFNTLSQPAARANMVRAAILAVEGGVYLDTDTITVASLTPLRKRATAFCGLERIVLPYTVKSSHSPAVWLTAGLRLAARDLFRRLPDGWRAFRRLEHLYPQAANNAVLACEPGHPFLRDMLDRMIATSPERQQVRFALGTHLLQQALAGTKASTIHAHPPGVFYPIGPEISEHWFRFTDNLALDEALLPETRVVHWYASVRTKPIVPKIDDAYIRANRDRQLFSALACRVLD